MYRQTMLTLLSTLLATTLALPSLQVRAEPCAPTSYSLTDFQLTTSGTGGAVSFTFKSTFADPTIIEDRVIDGSVCNAEGRPSIPNSNECNAPNRSLLFDLRAPQEKGRYQITHSWRCNGKQWMSGNDVTIDPITCEDFDGTRTCKIPGSGVQAIVPQNVRQIPTGP